MLPEWMITLVRIIAITIAILLTVIHSVQGGQAKANYYFSWSKAFDRFSVRTLQITLPIQTAIILIFGGMLPLWLYLVYVILCLIMVCLLIVALQKQVGIFGLPVSLCNSEGAQLTLLLLIAFIFVFFVMGAAILGFIIAMML